MTELDRDQRIARQQLDPGDPDDEVYRRTNTTRGRALFYHSDPDCCRKKDHPNTTYRTTTRATAQRNWRAPCSYCAIDHDHPAVSSAFGSPQVDDAALAERDGEVPADD